MDNWTKHIREINRVTLSFTDNREDDFRQYYFDNSIITTRVSFALLAFIYGFFSYLDSVVAENYFNLFLYIRFVIVVPMLLLVFALSFSKSFIKYWQELLFVTYLTAAIGIISMIVLLPNYVIYSNGMMLIFLAGSVFIKLRFLLGSIAGWISILVYNVVSLVFFDIEVNIIITNNFFFVGAVVIGMFASYHAEIFDRRNFELLRQIAKKNQEIEETNESLEKKVESRTKLLNVRNEELQNEIARRIVIEQELIGAKEKAEQSDKLKSAFLANMSHEIRTPMNGIIGFANLLPDAEDEEELHEFIEIIKSNGDHLLDLINDIIDLSKIEAGILDVHKKTFNLNVLTKEIYDLFLIDHNVIDKKLSVKINNGLEDEKANIVTDRIRLKQMLINLVNNACKYSDKGEIELGYSVDGNRLSVYVKDEGIGISEEQQENIFNRFMQVTLNNTPNRESKGLGLAITKTYLKMMGGNIKVRSKLNVGSEFSFYLPIEFDD